MNERQSPIKALHVITVTNHFLRNVEKTILIGKNVECNWSIYTCNEIYEMSTQIVSLLIACAFAWAKWCAFQWGPLATTVSCAADIFAFAVFIDCGFRSRFYICPQRCVRLFIFLLFPAKLSWIRQTLGTLFNDFPQTWPAVYKARSVWNFNAADVGGSWCGWYAFSNTMHLRPSSNVSAITSLLYILSTNFSSISSTSLSKRSCVLKDGEMQSWHWENFASNSKHFFPHNSQMRIPCHSLGMHEKM